jgi:hypothetical protein
VRPAGARWRRGRRPGARRACGVSDDTRGQPVSRPCRRPPACARG